MEEVWAFAAGEGTLRQGGATLTEIEAAWGRIILTESHRTLAIEQELQGMYIVEG